MSNGDGGNLPRGLFYVALIFGAFFAGQSSFEALRPTQKQTIDYQESTNFSVQARLWQDPLTAVKDYFNYTDNPGNPIGDQKLLKKPMLSLLSAVIWEDPILKSCWQQSFTEQKDPEQSCWNEHHNTLEEKLKDKITQQYIGRKLGLDYRAAQNTDAYDIIHGQIKSLFNGINITPNLIQEFIALGNKDDKSELINKAITIHHESVQQGQATTNTLFMGVLIPGGPYAAEKERRTRSRYAVISALTEAGYIPENPRFLSTWSNPKDSNCKNQQQCLVSIAPYEWFIKNPLHNHKKQEGTPAKYQAVVVFWFKEEDFKTRPLAKMAAMTQLIEKTVSANLQSQCKSPHTSTNTNELKTSKQCPNKNATSTADIFNYAFLAPSSSDTIVAASQEKLCTFHNDDPSKAHECVDPKTPFDRLKLINWSSTLALDNDQKDPDNVIYQFIQNGTLISTIHNDERLAEQLTKEVSLRTSHNKSKQAKVAILIAESDTYYGRNLPHSFSKKLTEQNYKVKQVHYLRGLDGQLPGDLKKKGAKESPDSKDEIRQLSSQNHHVELPVGRSQYDYLRRLVYQIKSIENKDNIQLIGILGSDIYDKILLLQALRREFPEQLFFSTDMYASYLHPAVYAHARNLIVLSSYGLGLNPDIQQQTAPFRDSYQTSLYVATREATENNFPLLSDCFPPFGIEKEKNTKTHCENYQPRIFEIGRGKAFDISSYNTTNDTLHPAAHNQISKPQLIHAIKAKGIYFVAIIALLTVIYILLKRYYTKPLDKVHRKPIFLWGIIWIIANILLSLIILSNTNESSEPLALISGTSIWATLYIRVTCGIIACYCIHLIAKRWHNLRAFDLKNDYFYAINEDTEKQQPTYQVWREFTQRYKTADVIKRIGSLSFVYLLLSATLISMAGAPETPIRAGNLGALMFLDRFVIIICAALPLTLLIFYVIDIVSNCRRLMKAIISTENHWPDSVIKSRCQFHTNFPEKFEGWVDAMFIADISKTISGFIYYPFIVILLLLTARLPIFDNWVMHYSIVIVIICNLSYCIFCAFILRNKAEKVRNRCIEELENARIDALSSRTNNRQITEQQRGLSNQLNLLIEEVKSLNEGAFAPLTEQPWFRVLAMIFGGGGSLILLESLLVGGLGI